MCLWTEKNIWIVFSLILVVPIWSFSYIRPEENVLIFVFHPLHTVICVSYLQYFMIWNLPNSFFLFRAHHKNTDPHKKISSISELFVLLTLACFSHILVFSSYIIVLFKILNKNKYLIENLPYISPWEFFQIHW